MSQVSLSNFNWPIAGPGAPDVPTCILDKLPALSTIPFMEASSLSVVPGPAGSGIPSTPNTVHITVISTVLQVPVTDTPIVSLIHQTKPLEFIIPVRLTEIVESVPEMTIKAFEFYTPSADASVSVLAAAPTKPNSGPTPDASPSEIPKTFASHNFGAKITGILVGAVTFVFMLGIALAYWRARRRTAKANESSPVDMEAVLEEKRERAEYLGRQRWSRRNTRQGHERFPALPANSAARKAAKKEPTIVEESEDTTSEIQSPQAPYDRARRPSGLAMHPPTSVTSEQVPRREEHDGKDLGRAG